MTSGIFKTVPVDSIVVPEHRQRKEFKEDDLVALADSIRRLGLIHPLVVEKGTLVSGERRLRAVQSLGWTTVPVQEATDLGDRDRRAIELEENTKRSDLSWQELAEAILSFHEDRVAETAEWAFEDTAASLGYSDSSIARYVQTAQEIRAGNKAVAEAPKLSTAAGLVARANERKKASEVASLMETIYDKPLEKFEPVKQGDFREFLNLYDGPRFNLIHCDFPYGINADRMQQGYSVGEHGGYQDTPELYFELLDAFVSKCDRIVDDSAHLFFWFSMKYYTETLQMLRRTRFIIDDFPLIWTKDVGLLPDPNRGPRRVYETAFFGRAGDRKIVRAVSNSVYLPRGSDHIHMSVKPVPVLEHFFRMLVDSTTTLFDPTAGGGTALQAALALGARSAAGLEINGEFVERANTALQKQRNELLKKENGNAQG